MPEYPIYDSLFFDVREWVDQRTWEALGPQSASLIDPRIVHVADQLRIDTDAPLIINNWHFRKRNERLYDSSGFRAVWDRTGGQLSQHRRGFAADLKSKTHTPAQLQALIVARANKYLELGLTTMENLQYTPTWLHCDCRVLPSAWQALATPFLIVSPKA